MIIGKLEKKLGVWQFSFRISKNPDHQLGFHPFISLWIVNFKSFPYEGDAIGPKNYDGIHWTVRLWPQEITMYRWTVRSIAEKFNLREKGIPKWVPKWVLMKDGRGYHTGEPRKWLIDLLAKRFLITIPIKIKL